MDSDLTRRIKAASKISVTVEISLVTYIRALLWGVGRDGRPIEKMMAAIIADRCANSDNLSEAFKAANTQAAIIGVPTADYIRQVIQESGLRLRELNLAEIPDDVLLRLFDVVPSGAVDVGVFQEN
jgi:hypothetical protein